MSIINTKSWFPKRMPKRKAEIGLDVKDNGGIKVVKDTESAFSKLQKRINGFKSEKLARGLAKVSQVAADSVTQLTKVGFSVRDLATKGFSAMTGAISDNSEAGKRINGLFKTMHGILFKTLGPVLLKVIGFLENLFANPAFNAAVDVFAKVVGGTLSFVFDKLVHVATWAINAASAVTGFISKAAGFLGFDEFADKADNFAEGISRVADAIKDSGEKADKATFSLTQFDEIKKKIAKPGPAIHFVSKDDLEEVDIKIGAMAGSLALLNEIAEELEEKFLFSPDSTSRIKILEDLDAYKRKIEEIKEVLDRPSPAIGPIAEDELEEVEIIIGKIAEFHDYAKERLAVITELGIEAGLAISSGIGAALAGNRDALVEIGQDLKAITADLFASLAKSFAAQAAAAAVAGHYGKALRLSAAAALLSAGGGFVSNLGFGGGGGAAQGSLGNLGSVSTSAPSASISGRIIPQTVPIIQNTTIVQLDSDLQPIVREISVRQKESFTT